MENKLAVLFMGIFLLLCAITGIAGIAYVILCWLNDRARNRRQKARYLSSETLDASEKLSLGYFDFNDAISSTPRYVQPPTKRSTKFVQDGHLSSATLQRSRVQQPIFEEGNSLQQTSSPHGKKVLGYLRFFLTYSVTTKELVIEIVGADHLPDRSNLPLPNTYVELQLLPDSHNSVRTRVHHRTLNPLWNEIFVFEGLSRSQLADRSVQFVVIYRSSHGNPDSPIGQVTQSIEFLAKRKHLHRTWDFLRQLEPFPTTSSSTME